uniref:Uncharacterized protein n=1 Tax=Lepeophtheirus salmonis TaxID=72036 RepID=A0A0K2UK39_LEPSM
MLKIILTSQFTMGVFISITSLPTSSINFMMVPREGMG